jgi:hypothetical protein
MDKINVAVKCEEIWQMCAVQAICECSWETVKANDRLNEYPIVYTNESKAAYNWSFQHPTAPVVSFDEFVLEYGELMHEVKGEWRPELE